MASAGAPSEAIAIAVDAIEQCQQEGKQRRARNAQRMRTVRAQSTHGACTDDAQCDTRAAQNPSLSPERKVSPCTPSKEINPSPTPPLAAEAGGRCATRPAVEQAFEEFWRAYPKRDGANPRAPAAKKFAAALKAGCQSEEIVAGARAYRSACDAGKLTGTPMVAQAITWLNQQRWSDYQAQPPPEAEPEPTPEQLAERQRMIEQGEQILIRQGVLNGAGN